MPRRSGPIVREPVAAPRAVGRPARLSRESIVEAAVDIVRARGMQALTMRALAGELDATPMALYRHVGDRDELALLVTDALLARIALPDTSLPAVAWLRALAHEIRAVGRAHPGVMDILLEEGPAARSSLVILDGAVRKLHEEGASWREAAALHNTFFSWLAAEIRREERWASRGAKAPPVLRRFIDAARRMPTSEFPGLAHVLPYMPGADVDTEFESSLSFMLDGIAARLAGRSAPKAAQRSAGRKR